MIRTLHLLSLVAIAGLAYGLIPAASAQSRGLASKNELQPQAAVKSLQSQALGLADKSHLLDSNASALAGLNSAGNSKSLALRNGVGPRVEQPKPLKNRVVVNRHPGQRVWASAFNDIEVHQESSQGKFPTGPSFLQEHHASKDSLGSDASHGFTDSPKSSLTKEAKGLQ